MISWKGCKRKRSYPVWGSAPEFSWRDREKLH